MKTIIKQSALSILVALGLVAMPSAHAANETLRIGFSQHGSIQVMTYEFVAR